MKSFPKPFPKICPEVGCWHVYTRIQIYQRQRCWKCGKFKPIYRKLEENNGGSNPNHSR